MRELRRKTTIALFAALFLTSLLFLFYSCEIGLGAAVDISIPTVGISYPPKNAVARDSFIVSGNCNDDVNVVAVSVSLSNPETNENFGPYDAELSEDAKSWRLLVNKNDTSKVTNEFDSYKQWEIPDGNYIINAIAFDKVQKKSQIASSPISIDNTAPVLIVSKPLAIGSDTATVYGRSFKLSGDIAEEHETSKLVLYYRQFDSLTDEFIDSETRSLEITDSSELNAMSSSNPLILAKFDENKKDSAAFQRYAAIYGQEDNNVDKYYYCGFMLEDNALVYQNPGDSGSGNGNQTKNYYLLSSDFQNNLAVNYSLTVQRLMKILRGDSEDYNEAQIKDISEILLKSGNYASSFDLVNSDDSSRQALADKSLNSKFSLNPHNNPTWCLDEYGVAKDIVASDIKSYSAGSSLILSLRAGRDASYPDPKTVKADFYDLGEYNPATNYSQISITDKNPISLIDPEGETKWDESADDAEKTYTFTLNTQDYELYSKHIYRMIVTGTDRNKTDLEPENDNLYLFSLSTSNNSPKVSILEPAEDVVYGTQVNEDGVKVKGYVITDGVPLKSKENGGITISSIAITDLEDSSITNADLNNYDFDVLIKEEGRNKYLYEVLIKAKTGQTFVPSEESKYYYTVTVRASDMGETAPGEKSIKFYVDNKKPELRIISISPDDGTGTVNGNIKISGIASDSGNTGSDLKSLSYVIKNSASQTLAQDFDNVEIALNESWNFDLSTSKLFAGSTNSSEESFDIIVSAQDKVGNIATTQKTIVINQLNDMPVFELSNASKDIAAASGLGTDTNLFPSTAGNKLYGSVKDDDGLGSVIVTCKKTGPVASGSVTTLNAAKALVPGTKLYDFEYSLPSEEGQYEVKVEAKDIYALASATDTAKKETNFDNLTHTFFVTIDDGAPIFTSVTPAVNENSWYMGSKTGSSKQLVITGIVSDGNGFAASDALTVTHTAKESSNENPESVLTANAQSQTAKTFTDKITLPSTSGTYKASYTAKDIYGQSALYELEYSVDVDAPQIEGQIKVGTNNVDQNSNSIEDYITQNNIPVEVYVKDEASGIKNVSYTFDNPVTDETSFVLMTHAVSGESGTSEKWTANIVFPDGDDVKFTIRVTDNVGNYTDKTITTKVDKTNPLLEVKWYQIKAANAQEDDGSILVPGDTAYVNTKDIVLYGNYTDSENCSGINELHFKIGENAITPAITYYKNKGFEDDPAKVGELVNAKSKDAQGNVIDVNPYECTYSQDNSKLIKAFKAVINHDSFANGDLTVTATDYAGNAINGGSLKIMTLRNDTENPKISGVNVGKFITENSEQKFKEAYKIEDGKYYVNNTADTSLVVTGTTTDNSSIDKTVLTVTATDAGEIKQVYKEESTETSWTFNNINLSNCQIVATQESFKDAVLKITAFDKAGNTVSAQDITFVFDQEAPAVLTGGSGGSDPLDSSNPFTAGYTLRGKTVKKYGGIKIGNGTYSDSSYGREASVPLTVTFVGETGGSGIAKIEYKMLAVSKVTSAYNNVSTGNYTGSIPADAECTTIGEFAIEQSKYTHYGDSTEIPCTLGKATILGFESTVNGQANIVFVRAIDNCGNEGQWFAILVQVDDSNPENTVLNAPTSLLTNGKKALQTLTGKYEDKGAGLKALRIYVDGKIAIDGCLKNITGNGTEFTIENTDPNKILTITAKDAQGNDVAPSDNGAVNVTFTNKYGTLTYNAYYKDENGTDKPDSFANGPSYANWSLTLTPQKGSWFNALTKSAPQISIEAEDWAEDASGSGNKSTALITSLDIDKSLPVTSITSPNAQEGLNGKQTIKGSVTENHTPQTVEIYYSNVALNNGNMPDSLKNLSNWTLLKSITTATGTNDASHQYNASVQQIYNFELKNIDFDTLIGTDAQGHALESGIVHILVRAQDKAGNYNLEDGALTSGQSNSSKAYQTFTVDRNSDRPLVIVTSIDLVTEIKNKDGDVIQTNPLSQSNYLPLDTSSVNFKVTDDDGISQVDYRITKYGQAPAESGENGWKTISEISAISTNGATIKFPAEGKQTLEFRIKDTENEKFFYSVLPADAETNGLTDLNRIYLADTSNHKYGTTTSGYEIPVVYVDIDIKPPVLTIEGVQFLKAQSDAQEIADAELFTSGYSNTIVGGPDKQYLRIKVSASDDGSGVNTVEGSARLDDTPVTDNAIEGTKSSDANETGIYYIIIPTFKVRETSLTKDNSSYIATVTVIDKAGKEASDSLNFKLDDKLPAISIRSPASTDNLSGASTIDGSISETAKLYYAISPIEASPDGYTDTTDFSFVKYDSNDNATTVDLPANNKAGRTINPKQALKDLCAYQDLGSSKMMSFYLWLDGKLDSQTGIHTNALNQWIKDIGITCEEDLSAPVNPFADIVQLYFHVKAIDTAGNVNELHYPIRLDPLGSRPQIKIGYPSEEKAGGNNSLTLGGAPSIIGTAKGTNAVDYVWLQVDCNEDGEWTEDDFNYLASQKDSSNNSVYELGKMTSKQQTVTSIASGDSAGVYAIRVRVSGQSWSQKININGELNPPPNAQQNTNEPNTKHVKIWAYATDIQNFTSSVEVRNIEIDSDVPVIDQNIRLVQWAKKANSQNFYSGEDGFDVDENGNITFAENAIAANREYIEGEGIIGKWYAIGKVTDESGIKSITYTVNGTKTVRAITATGKEYPAQDTTEADEGVYIKKIPSKTANSYDYIFCIPIGDDTPGKVGEYSINFTAEENKDSNARSADLLLKVSYDNLAPVIAASSVPANIVNSDGVYTFGGEAAEDKVNNVAQTGVERIAFYFTRNITGDNANKELIFDPMIRIGIPGNSQTYSALTNDSGLYWQSLVANMVTGSSIKLKGTPDLTNVHKGGLAKINGVIYRIEGVDDSNKTVSLSGNPGDTTSETNVLFAIANVVDNPTREGQGDTRITDDYGWGYYSGGSFDDDDYMIESLIDEDTKYNWTVSINSKNISDGPVTLHYVVFDNAGNASAVQTFDCFVKNNEPRLAGVKFGTDENGNDEVDEDELTTKHLYENGFSGTTKVTSLTLPLNVSTSAPTSILKIKGKTVIEPEIVGGNGMVKYTYSVAKRNGNDWGAAYYTTPDAIELQNGTIDDDDPVGNYTWSKPIELTVKEFLKNGIVDGEKQKFIFEISDSTPTQSQSATLTLIMDVAINDTTSAMNKMIPFYWKSNSVNSLKDNSQENGHIELSKDLAGTGLTLTPKVSGAIKLEGIAKDNSLLSELSVSISSYNSGNPVTIATYSNGSWSPKDSSITITNATYEDFKNAGYIDEIPEGKNGEEPVPEVSQEYGHVVHWTMILDTEAMLTSATNISIKARALDKGKPDLNGENVVYQSNKFDYNGSGTLEEGQTEYTEPTTVVQTGGNDGSAAYTYNYTIDVVPYVRGIKTKLSTKSKKSDSSEYDRTALGHYPISKSEVIYLYGFNLAGGTLYDSSYETVAEGDQAKHKAALGTAIKESDTPKPEIFTKYESYKGFTLYPTSANALVNFTSGPVYVKVGNVASLNNSNNDNSKGSYQDSDYAHFYNRKPNNKNNNTLTDDIVLDVWNINSEAGQPSYGGRVDEPVMKINPYNDIVGFAFLDGPRDFSRPNKAAVSYSRFGDRRYGSQDDSHTTAALAYDTHGNIFTLNAGGNEGDPVHFSIFNSTGTMKSIYIEYVNQKTKRSEPNTASYLDLRYKVRSPNIVTSPNGDDTNVYMVYYDSYNDEIRYKSGLLSTIKSSDFGGDLFHSRRDNDNGKTWNGDNPYSCKYSQVIATDAATNLPLKDGSIDPAYAYSGTPLGGAGEFVDIDVIPKGTDGGQNNNDIVVVVWYDAKAKALKYSYNKDPNNYASWPAKNGSTDKNADYKGLNREKWENAKTIFNGAGEYCSVKVDGKGGIHIAAYDPTFGDLYYAYMSSYTADAQVYTVDSAGNVGSHMRMDVGLASDGTTPIPYISYYGSNMAKLAFPKTNAGTNGAESDMFTGNWEVTYIPTTSEIDDLDYKRLSNIDNRINVGVWKYIDTVSDANATETNPAHQRGQIKKSKTGNSSGGAGSGTCWGNGTANPMVAYSVLKDTANSRIETAQMQ